MSKERPKLNYQEQIEHMKGKGIKFSVMTEEDALHFLESNNYYFKLKAYAKNYDKWFTGPDKDKYKDLEFAYLVELSTLDMQLRYLIIKMCLDIEHFLKIALLKDVNENVQENGYEIVKKFFAFHPDVKEDLNVKKNKSSCKDVIEKYIEDPAIWNIVEVLSFGQFTDLYELYYYQYENKKNYRAYLGCVKFIRNAAAQNNCLLNRIKKPYSVEFIKSKRISSEISKIKGIKTLTMQKMLANPVIHDFVALICLYDKAITSVAVKSHRYEELNDLINKRFIKHKDYFDNNTYIKDAYNFIKLVVDNYL